MTIYEYYVYIYIFNKNINIGSNAEQYLLKIYR